jgi:hypothetical protein
MLCKLMEDRDDLLTIEPGGVARPVGALAAQRMQARNGSFRVLPSPAHVVFLRHAIDGQEPDGRACVLAGEVRASGALCDVVSFIGHTSYRGELIVIDKTASRSIFFDQGQVVGAQSSAEKERLGEVLYRYGILTEEQVAACDHAMTQEGVRFGEAAVKHGHITRERLFGLMGKQSEEIFYAMLLVNTGAFYFLDGYDEASLSSRQSLSVASLIREGVRRMHEMRYFRARIKTDQHVPARVAGRTPPENDPLEVYTNVDGVRSVADICRAVGQGEFEVSRVLFQLVQAGHVAIKPPRLKPKSVVEVYNQAIALLLRELDAMDQGDDVRTQLAAWVDKEGTYGQLFVGAGPADDGTLNAGAIAENVAKMPRPVEAEEMVAGWLFEYASYALFLARPHMRRAEQARSIRPGEPIATREPITSRIASLLEPIAPPGSVTGGPPGAQPPKKR